MSFDCLICVWVHISSVCVCLSTCGSWTVDTDVRTHKYKHVYTCTPTYANRNCTHVRLPGGPHNSNSFCSGGKAGFLCPAELRSEAVDAVMDLRQAISHLATSLLMPSSLIRSVKARGLYMSTHSALAVADVCSLPEVLAAGTGAVLHGPVQCRV